MTDIAEHTPQTALTDQAAGEAANVGAVDAAFLALVGQRVREARQSAGLSRRALSDMSDVSQRYLANLEAGIGNISIGLLKRIADALDTPVEGFVAVGPTEPGEPKDIAALFHRANPETRQRVLDLLQTVCPVAPKGQRVALIGLRGAGKSTLGRLSAARLGVPFVELNQDIQRTTGMPVTEIMALYGQEGYRRLERQVVETRAGSADALIMAVAGGIVSEPETFQFLLAHYHTVWLKAKPDEHMMRVQEQGDTRPMAGFPEAMQSLKSILASREALYAQSDAALDTSGRSVDQSLTDLLALIAARGFIKVG
jgi:XRE family aerobic/anaerobic benzoate catabolism transcriptional regulator